MILMDVNIFVYAFRKDMPDHREYRAWLSHVVNAPSAFGICDLVLSGFCRIVTNSKIFKEPSSWSEVSEFVEKIRNQPNCRRIEFGDRHWSIFTDLCRASNAKGNLVPDAFLAALAIESGCEWITTDRDYAKFPGLKWRHPLKK